jgi:hypothetical protein
MAPSSVDNPVTTVARQPAAKKTGKKGGSRIRKKGLFGL